MRYTLYKVRNTKSQIRGYWLDKGKLYKDNITQGKYTLRGLDKVVKTLFKTGQQAVFYKDNVFAYCVDKKGKLTVYHNKILIKRKKLSPKEVKLLLYKFGGLTIYNHKRTKGVYFIEVFYNKRG